MSDLLTRVTERARALSTEGKAMAELHPEFGDRVHITEIRQGQIAAASSYSYLLALNDYQQHVWVRKACSLLMNNFAALPLRVERAEEPVEGHELTRLFSDVNESMSSVDLWKWWMADMLLAGEAGFELVKNGRGRYSELWPRQPHTVIIIPDETSKRYYKVAAYRIDDGKGPSYDLPPEEFLHTKFFNPRNPWRGLSVISAVRQSILIDTFAQAWSRLFFTKSARPDYAVISKGGLTVTEREDLEKKLTSKFGGLENAHKPIVLEEEVTDLKLIDYRPKDIEWLVQREMARDEVGGCFGVPDGLMGWGQESYDTATKLEGDMRALWTLTLLPLVLQRDTSLTEYFRRVGALRPEEALVTDLSSVGVLKQDVTQLITAASALFDRGLPWSTINNYLGMGLPEFEGWEVGYLQGTLLPANFEPQQRMLSGKRAKAPEFGSQEHKTAWERKDRRLDPIRRDMKRKLQREIERQGKEAVSRLQSAKALLNGSTLSKLRAGDVFDLEAEVRRFKREFKQLIEDAVARAGQDELDELGVDFDFDLERPAVKEALDELLTNFAEKTNDSTYEALKTLFERAAEDGVALAEIEERLSVYFEGRRSEASVERIARTTMTGANGAGDQSAWEQSEVVTGKEWLATLDDRVRDEHEEAHGQAVGLDEDFTVGGESLRYPGDPAGDPSNIVNCRCSQLPVLREGKTRNWAPRATRSHGRPILPAPEERALARLGGKVVRALPEPAGELSALAREAAREITLEDLLLALRRELGERLGGLEAHQRDLAEALGSLTQVPARQGMLERALAEVRGTVHSLGGELNALPRLPQDLAQQLAEQVKTDVLRAAAGRTVVKLEVLTTDSVDRPVRVRRNFSDGSTEVLCVERDGEGRLIGLKPEESQ
jgi:HK97 family phage portal protein